MDKHSQFETRNPGPELTCSDFDALLSDALDGTLSTLAQRRFDLHRQSCPTCGPLFAETSAGLNWLSALEEIEPPTNLVHNILAATTTQTVTATAAAPKLAWKQRLSELLSDVLAPARALVRQPRMAMTGAMAVFSITLSLNMAGVKLTDLRHVDLRPSAIKEQATMRYYETTSRVVKYYENIRLVYEVQAYVQEIKRATTTEEQDRPPATRNKSDNQKQDRERKQNYYSMEQQHMLLANWSTSELNNRRNLQCSQAATSAASEEQSSLLTIASFRGVKPFEHSGSAKVENRAVNRLLGRSILA